MGAPKASKTFCCVIISDNAICRGISHFVCTEEFTRLTYQISKKKERGHIASVK